MGISKREVIIAQLTAVLSYCGCPIDIRLEETSTYYYSCDADGGSALALADAGKSAGETALTIYLEYNADATGSSGNASLHE